MRILFCLFLLIIESSFAMKDVVEGLCTMREGYNSFHELGEQLIALKGRTTVKSYDDISAFVPREAMNSLNGTKLLLQLDAEVIVSHLANELGLIEDEKGMLRKWKEFVDFLEQECNTELQNVLKSTTNFLYCWGLVGYYCFDRVSDGWDFRAAFEKYTGITLSKKNALDLIVKSHSEKAEIFLGNIGEDK